MNEAKNQSLQSHSVQGYMQRLHTKELLQLLHFYIENEPNITFSVEEIIHILKTVQINPKVTRQYYKN